MFNLWSSQRRKKAGGAPAVATPNEPIPTPSADPGQFMDALATLQEQAREPAAGPPEAKGLAERVFKTLASRQGRADGIPEIGPREHDMVRVVENLLGNIRRDILLAQGIRKWMDKLEVPLLKAALVDQQALSGADNPVSQLVNKLERLDAAIGDDITPRAGQVGERIDQLINRLLREFEWDLSPFADIGQELDRLLAPHQEAYERSVGRVVQICDGQQRLVEARERVYLELSHRLGGQRVPPCVVELVDRHWRHLLLHVYLREGPDADPWAKYLWALDRVLAARDKEQAIKTANEQKELIGVLQQGLLAAGGDRDQAAALLKDLNRVALGRSLEETWVEFPPLEEPASSREDLPTLQQALANPPPDLPAGQWTEWLERAQSLIKDDWVMFHEADGGGSPLKLVWKSNEGRRFVFVDKRGIKRAEYNLPELARRFGEGQAYPMQELNQPLMERASQQMLERLHKEIVRQATHDPLTGLLNRREFEQRIAAALEQAAGGRERHVLIHLDIDQLNLINNALDYQAGDRYLQEFAKLLRQQAGPRVTGARLGDDSFGLLLEQCSLEAGEEIAERLRKAVQEFRFAAGDKRFSLTISLGLTQLGEQGGDLERALKEADAACEQAKKMGRNRVQRYQASDHALTERHRLAVLLSELMAALESNELQLYAQEIVSLELKEDRHPFHEIFLRLPDGPMGPRPIAEYIRAAEYYNRMPEVDRWLVHRVLKWLSSPQGRLTGQGVYTLNISGATLNDPAFVSYVLQELAQNGIAAQRICFELTETAAIDNVIRAAEYIAAIKKAGCQVSLDDFGTGMASFAALKRLPVDYLKIAGNFVREIARSPEDHAMVKSINEVGHFLGKATIAEFVEDNQTLELLEEIGVDYVQGKVIGMPRLLSLG